MSMIVHSPYDGHPVKVRDQDLERAIRDNEGRIFYAVRRSSGQGYYGALTRQGSEKDEQRYLEMLEKMDRAHEVGAQRSAQQIHDATGKATGTGVMRWLALFIILTVIAVVAWLVFGPDKNSPSNGHPGVDAPSPLGAVGANPQNLADIATLRPSGRFHQPMSGDTENETQGYVGTASGLRYTILRHGAGDTAVAGKFVQVRYSVWNLAGVQIEVSDAKHPVGFVLWAGHAPRGWDEGVAGMRVGEKRRLILTHDLLYGPYPGEVQLPDTALRFDIELVGVLPGIRSTTVTVGNGTIARPGDTVSVHYRAYLNRENTEYDNTYDRGEPLEFRIGTGEVIQGWELGVIGMAEGETRTIEIPPYLGYGQRGAAGVIPPNTTLRYTVQLIRVTGPTSRHADVGYHNEG